VVLAGGWYWFLAQDQLDRLSQVESKETELRATFESRQRLAANLETHREQLAEMDELFKDLVRQLPGGDEIAALLVDVSQTGLATGLEFELFQPTAEVSSNFYAELPIQVEVTGGYHELASFVSGLAALPRIVTVHDVIISSQHKDTPDPTTSSKLSMRATVKTYRYLEESEMAQGEERKKGAKGTKAQANRGDQGVKKEPANK
jgi:type IV pilus assembly protein PilO